MEEVTGETAVTKTETSQPTTVKSETQAASVAPQAPTMEVSGGENVIAPMPGTIVKITVKPGERVKKNQVLVVLEAMKMENEIVSPIDGTIIAVNVTKGQVVNTGESLVQVG
jgi:biotin carboxyl carrier protein